MKNLLLWAFCLAPLSAVEGFAMAPAAQQTFDTAKQRTTDTRPLVNQVQLGLLESVQGVFETLKIAEASYPTYSESDFTGVASKYSGLSNIGVIGNVITFFFNPAEINSNLGLSPFQLVYTPTLSGGSIASWDCSVRNLSSLGSDFIVPSTGPHPLTTGLGWPYEECTVPPIGGGGPEIGGGDPGLMPS